MDDPAATLETDLDPKQVAQTHHSKPVPASESAGRRVMKFSYPSGSKPLEGYTIKRGIGIGGFGEVYFALSDAGKEVALKKIQRNLDVELRGVRQCLNLKHVNLISLWDIKINEYGESWVVMEYVPGPSLRDTVEAHPKGMPEEQVKMWFSSTASGVAYLHEHGIVHRDLKPGNIFCDDDEQVIKIGDYGLSKFISCSRRSGQTESVGTFHYMAPEIGKGIYGKEIDIYALGIILFEMLTGDVPFDGESTQEIIMKHLTTDPDVSVAPEPFRDLLAKALRKDPELRYNSVQDMCADLPWPDIAAKSQAIISKHSVGPMTVPQAKRSTHDHIGKDLPIEISVPTEPAIGGVTNERYKGPPQVNSSQLPSVLISGDQIEVVPDAIVFGELRDSTRTPNAVNPNILSNRVRQNPPSFHGPQHMGSGDPIKVVRQSVAVGHSSGHVSNQPVADMRVSNITANAAPVIKEPIADAVGSGFNNLSQWWNQANFSTPVKMGLMLVAGIVVIQNSMWLLPAIMIAGVCYMLYYIGRVWIYDAETPDEPTEKQLALQTIQTVRHWIGARPAVDRATELIGALLIGAFGCIVLNLLGVAIGGEFGNSIEPWARFAWLTVTSIVATWALLICNKSWELRRGDHWLRRLVMIAIGLLIGAFAFFSANSFSLNLTEMAALDFHARQTEHFVFSGIPAFPAYLIFFAAMFGILRWWRQTDPVRRTRLSILSVLVCLIWAAVFSHLLSVPLTGNCILAVVISVSTQLASPWLHPDLREEICNDVLDGNERTDLASKLLV